MSFLGRKLVGHFQGQIVTDLSDLHHQRIPGVRIKHRVKQNWIKMYDKAGCVLRIETVINNPNEFRVRKSVRRRGRLTTEWVPMRKGVAYLFRYRDISHSANSRYLDALAVVDDPTTQVRQLDRLTRRRQSPTGALPKPSIHSRATSRTSSMRSWTGPTACVDSPIATSVGYLQYTSHLTPQRGDPHRESAKVSRILHRFHAHGLIAKIPRSHRWRTTRLGHRMMETAIQIREINFPQLLALAA